MAPMRSIALVLLWGMVLGSSAVAQTHVDPEWAFRWYWSTTESDQGDVMAFDNSGNIYVAGHTDTSASNNDWVLVKVNPAGSLVWSAIYDSPMDGIDAPEYIRIDNQGYIYVCGDVGRSSLAWKNDTGVVKFDPDGNQVWAYQFNGTASFDDYVEGFGMDSNGNVYVVGLTELFESPSPGREDYLLIKILPTGDTAWVRTMPTGNGTNDRLYDIAFDDGDNIYVTGGLSITGNLDIAMIKYNQNGDTLWMRTYNSPSSLAEQPFGIGIDDSGYVYVGGKTGANILAIKYNSNGNFIWDFDHAIVASNNVRDAIVSPDGRMYLVAEVTGTDIGVTCVSNAGGLLWDYGYNGGQKDIVFNSKSLLKLDNDGNIHFGGAMYVATSTTYTLTFKLDPNGDVVWYNRYAYVIPPNSGDFSQIRSVNVDQFGNCYSTGYSDGPFGNWDLFLLKFTGQSPYLLTEFDLLAPPNGDTIQTRTPDCIWSSSFDPDSGYAVSYQVYMSISPDFSNPILSDTLSDTSWTTSPLPPADSTFYWKVIAFNGHAPDRTSNQIFSLVVQDTTSGACAYLPGDINNFGGPNGIDVTYGVAYLKGSNPPPIDCNPPCDAVPYDPFYAAMDVNGTCSTNGIDITYFVAYLKGLQPSLLYCGDCPPAGMVSSPPAPAVMPIK